VKKKPTSVKSILGKFDRSAYDACAKWGLKEWASALTARSYMDSFFHHSSEDEITDGMAQYYRGKAGDLLANPLGHQSFEFDQLFLCPIVDQSVAAFFEGHDAMSDLRFSEWAIRKQYADNDYDDVEDIDLYLNEKIRSGVHKFHTTPAWKMKHQALGDIGRFFIGVDLGASDEFLMEQFKTWLKKTRVEANVHPIRRLFNSDHFSDWHCDRLLPYLDLSFCCKVNKEQVTHEEMAKLLFPYEEQRDSVARVRRTISVNALKLVSEEYVSALNTQFRTYPGM
jgi:hypothetical protein